MTLSNKEFIEQFENHTLDPAAFDHLGHLRIAWLYLNKYCLDQAIERVNNGIAGYASSLGATEKFRHTLTEAIVRIMAIRMQQAKHTDFSAFLEINADLVQDLPRVLAGYYSDDVLYSEEARIRFVAPDKAPLI